MIPHPTDLKYFLAVAETQSLSRAAERLGVVQPTLSMAMKRLEDVAGQPLLIRQKSGVTLTRAGERLTESCQALLTQWNHVLSEVAQIDDVASGNYSLGCHPSVALYSLRKFLPQLLEYPDLAIRIEHGLSREITEQIISRKLDFGLVINPVKHGDLVLKKICTDRVGFWKTETAPGNVLIYEPNLMQSNELLRRIRKQMNFDRQLTSSNLEVIADLAANHVGVAILPERVALRYKALKEFSNSWFTDELFLVYRADQQRTAAFKLIVETIAKAGI